MIRYRLEMLSARHKWVRAAFPGQSCVKLFLSVEKAVSCAKELSMEWYGVTPCCVSGPAAAYPFKWRIVKIETRETILFNRTYPVLKNEKEVQDDTRMV